MIAGFLKILCCVLAVTIVLLAGSIWFDEKDWRNGKRRK